MAVRFKKTGELRRHFIAEWRRFRHLSQDQLAERIGISKATLSRIENKKIPYSQGLLEACADALLCGPADLIMRNPEAPDAIWTVWEQIPETERAQAIEVLKTFRRTGS
jgi:transcriptional regulator with XRE-family HTH domain